MGQAREVVAEGGEATLCKAEFVEGLRDDQIEALFNTARDTDYVQIADDARELTGGLPPRLARDDERRGDLEAQLARLRKRVDDVTAIDFFGATGRVAAKGCTGLAPRKAPAARGDGPRSRGRALPRGLPRPHLGDAQERARRSHRVRVADSPIHRPGRDVQVRGAAGLPSCAGRGHVRHVRGGLHARRRPVFLRDARRAVRSAGVGPRAARRDHSRHRREGRKVRARRGA